jgi:ABC-type glycerol-3-phosphate transport system substrate-binding protein
MATSTHLTRRSFLRLAAGAGGAGLAGALAACGLAAPEPPATPTPPPPLTIWNWIDDALVTVVEGFNGANPQISVELQRFGYGQAHSQFASALAAGTGAPDVFLTDLNSLGALREQPGLADLGGAPFDGAALEPDFLPTLWEYGSFEGRQVALPWNLGVGVAWYRADLFEAAGLPSDPQAVAAQAGDWGGWLALDQELRRRNDTIGLVHSSLRLFAPAVEQQGHGFVDDNQLLIEERALPAAELLATLYGRDVPADMSDGEYTRRLASGAVAGFVEGSWQYLFLQRDFPQTAGIWRIARAPGGDFGAGALFLVIPQQSRQQEAAWEFARYLCASAAGQNLTFAASGALPAFRPAWQDPLYDRPVPFFGGQAAFRLLTQAAENIPRGVISPHDGQISELVWGEAGRVARGSKEPAQALADAEKAALQQIPGLTA